MKNPLTATRASLEQEFDIHVAPLFDPSAGGFRVRGISFDNHYSITRHHTVILNEVNIFMRIDATITREIRDAFRSYLRPLLLKEEGMMCMLNCYNTRIRLYLMFDNDPSDQFQVSPYINQNVILALQILREKAMQLNS